MKSAQKYRTPILIFGTSPDYVKRISAKYENDVLFIMDKNFQENDYIKDVDKGSLFFTDLDDFEKQIGSVVRYLFSKNIQPSGIACFDCESLINASRLAVKLDLPFPPVDGISKTRNKQQSKGIWEDHNIDCPKASIARNLKETMSFFQKLDNPVVVKPVSSSGSELTFYCRDKKQVADAVGIITQQLANRNSNPFFKKLPHEKGAKPVDPLTHWVVEEFIPGKEYSCDFIFREGEISVIRLTEKIRDYEQTFGSIMAYCIPANFPDGFSRKGFISTLKKAVSSLEITYGWFMADFIVNGNTPYILEITPRPGGDSIPDLIETATGKDILGMYLDFMSGRIKDIQPIEYNSKSLVSLNIYSPGPGIITELDFSSIETLPWVKKIYILRKIGDRIILPPLNYDNRTIGHAIIISSNRYDLKEKQRFLLGKIKLNLKEHEENPFIENKTEISIPCHHTA